MIVLEDLGIAQGWEKLSPTASTGITATLIEPTSGKMAGMKARTALIAVETYPIRIRLDGGTTAPTAANGIQLKADTYFTIVNLENIKNFRCINTSAGASAVHVQLFF